MLYAWKRDGSLYTASQHVASPYSYRRVVANLDRMTKGLVCSRRLLGAPCGSLDGGCWAAPPRGAAAARASTSSSTASSALAGPCRGRRRAAGAARARRCPSGRRQRGRRARAAAAPRGRDREARAWRRGRSPGRAGATLEQALRSPRRAVRADARRPRRRPSPGGCRTSAATFPAQAERISRRPPATGGARSRRPPCSRTPTLPQRSRRRRCSRRTTSPSCSAAIRASTIADGRAARSSTSSTAFHVTSIRKGFAGGGFDGGRACRSGWRLAAGVPGADLIPEQRRALPRLHLDAEGRASGRAKIANFETLGYVDLRRAATSRTARTCTCPTSTRTSRPGTSLRPPRACRHDVPARPRRPAGTLTVPQGLRRRAAAADVAAATTSRPADRSQRRRSSPRRGSAEDVAGPDGTRVPPRAPRSRSAPTSTRSTTRSSGARAPGARRLVGRAGRRPALRRLQPVERRLPPRPAGDGRHPPRRDGARPSSRAPEGRASTRCSSTTHRQNFLVPPRAHRSFPLAELRA